MLWVSTLKLSFFVHACQTSMCSILQTMCFLVKPRAYNEAVIKEAAKEYKDRKH